MSKRIYIILPDKTVAVLDRVASKGTRSRFIDRAVRHYVETQQNDIGNRHSPVTIVAAVTSKLSPTPYPVEVVAEPSQGNGLTLPSAISLGQIRSVDRARLVKRLGPLDAATMRKVDEALKMSLGLGDL